MERPGGRSELRHSRGWEGHPLGGSQRGPTLGFGPETEEEKQSKGDREVGGDGKAGFPEARGFIQHFPSAG